MIPAGCLRLPESYGKRLWSMLAKSRVHKYVRRVPIPGKTTKTGKPRYRYYYHAAHGGGVGAHEHMVEGAAFQHDGGHWHIKDATGDKLRIEHDESKETRHVTRAELAGMLEAAHAKDLADYRAKAAARVKEARESGASAKQIAALEEHVRRATAPTAPEAQGKFKPGKYTSKRGNIKEVAVLTGRVSTDEYRELADKAKEHGGSYVRDAGGFVFMGEDGFKRFMADQAGQSAPTASVAAPEAERPSAAASEPAAPRQPRAPGATKWTPPAEGSKSGGERIDAAEVAKKVRADIKDAIAAGGLPEGLKVSVKIDRYSMGQSVDVKITEAPFQVMSPERMAADAANPHGHVSLPRHTEQAKEVESRVNAILHAYNRRTDATDRHPAFYGHVNYDSDIEQAEREAHKQGTAPKVAAVVRPTREQAIATRAAAPTAERPQQDVAAQVAKLRDSADKLKSDAAGAMGRDRQVNTRRRAGMAANAIADAEHKQRMGETLARVAHAVETGEADALKGLTSRAQADVLHNASVQALYRAKQAAGVSIDWQNRDRDETPGADALRHVRLPTHDADAMARLARMGITTEPKLKAAVEEWNKFRKDRKSIGGGSVDAGEAKRKIDESAFMRQNIPGFFPTPKPLAERMAIEADIGPGMTVLEPSAGTGRLADAAKEAGGKVTTLERSQALAAHLRSKGHDVAGGDTLDHHGQYDRVVMNPPFENGQDMDHVRHAFDANLKPGGKLVAIMGEGAFFRQDGKASSFRDWLASVGGKSEKLPEGTFKESNTGVASRLVTVDKPAPVAGTGAHPKTPEVMASLSGRMTPTDAERANASTLYAAVRRSKTDGGAVEQGTQKVAALEQSIEGLTDKIMHTHDAHKRAQDAAGPTAGERHHRAAAELASQRDRKIAEYRAESAFLDAARAGEDKRTPPPKEITAAPKPGAHLTRASADDIPRNLAAAAHSGTSHVPDVRAEQERNGYVEHMRSVAAQLANHETPENSEAIKAALEDYRQGYLKRTKDHLAAKSRVMSSTVTGPARFPVRSNEKKGNTADARREELISWSEGARKRMLADFNPEAKRAISSDRPDAVDAIQTKLAGLEKQQALMVAANKVYRNAKLSDDEKVGKLKDLGMSEHVARAGLKPDFAGRIGFADYATKNNAAEIRRLRERAASVAQEQGKATTEHEFDGGRVVDDAESNRVRIYHDEKPPPETIAKLKHHGFKWTPSEGAWQRQRSDQARYHAGVITGAKVLKGSRVDGFLSPLTSAFEELTR